jgi:hypothetical protein
MAGPWNGLRRAKPVARQDDQAVTMMRRPCGRCVELRTPPTLLCVREGASGHEQTRSRESFVIDLNMLDAVWPEMTGRNMQRVATQKPDMLSRRFRLTGREQHVTTARQRAASSSTICVSVTENVRMLDRSSARPVVAPTQMRAGGTGLLRMAGGLGIGPRVNLRRNHRPVGLLRVNLIAPIGGP